MPSSFRRGCGWYAALFARRYILTVCSFTPFSELFSDVFGCFFTRFQQASCPASCTASCTARRSCGRPRRRSYERLRKRRSRRSPLRFSGRASRHGLSRLISSSKSALNFFLFAPTARSCRVVFQTPMTQGKIRRLIFEEL